MSYIIHWLPLHYFELDSTQSEAARLISSGRALHGNVIVTDLQRSGYGRYNRSWESQSEDLMTTLILRIPINRSLNQIAHISYVIAISIANLVANICLITKPDVKLKWINDVIVDGGKIAGILLQKIDPFVIIGIGVNFAKKNIPMVRTSSINQYSNIKKEEFLKLLLKEFRRNYNHWLDYGLEPIRNVWLQYSYEICSDIYLKNFKQIVRGKYLGIGENGELIIKKIENVGCDQSKKIEKFYAVDTLELL